MNQQSLFPDDQYTPPTETAKRDEACEQVVENAGTDWRDDATAILAIMTGEITGEDLRQECLKHGIQPHHHNAWGGLVMRLVREGRLVWTGKERAMRAKGSHGRRTRVYEITGR